jgi:hypothetical protein
VDGQKFPKHNGLLHSDGINLDFPGFLGINVFRQMKERRDPSHSSGQLGTPILDGFKLTIIPEFSLRAPPELEPSVA